LEYRPWRIYFAAKFATIHLGSLEKKLIMKSHASITTWGLLGLALTGAALLNVAAAQDKGAPKAAPKGGQAKQAPQPPPLPCGVHGDAEVICGAVAPEDLELTPDGKFLIVSQYASFRGGAAPAGGPPAPFTLFDPDKKTFVPLLMGIDPMKDWGDAACPGPIGTALAPHGISLSKRSGGKWQFYVVNHGGRESIEMYELKKSSGTWGLTWHGCVVSKKDFNDVAGLPDGGFVGTHPTALQTGGGGGLNLNGPPSGFVVSWMPGKGETELMGTRSGYPNGVLASSDGRFVYFAAWTAKEVHKYDLKEGKEVGMLKLSFMPDNLTWTKKNQILAAGIMGVGGDCGGAPCIQVFGVAEVDPAKMTSKMVYDSTGKGALIPGASSALEDGNAIYIGAFQGDRLVKIAAKK
jgi:SMP-30/Gluconolactonase/LRE-like region